MSTQISIKNIIVLAVTLVVTACTTTSTPEVSKTNSFPSHKHILSIKSTDQDLTNGLIQLLNTPFVNIYPQYKAGGYTLSISKKENTATLLGKPQLFGMLRKESRPTSFITSYILRTFSGEVLTSGEVVTVGRNHTIITPSLARHTQLTPEVIADIATQIQPILEQNLYPIPWQAVVIRKHDYRHIIIQSSKQENIRIGEVFTAPNGASLQVVSFDATSGLAILTVVEGLLPAVGSKLTLIDSAENF